MAKKIKKDDDNIYELGGGFGLKPVISVPDEHGNNIEVIPYYQKEIFSGIENTRKYELFTDAIDHWRNILIPNFIFNAEARTNGLVSNIKLLESKDAQKMFVNRLLYDKRNEIFFNSHIDIISGMHDYGFVIPNEDEYGIRGDIDKYYHTVNSINKVLLETLSGFGFSPDRNMSNLHYIDKKSVDKNEYCKNIVFTRLHIVVGKRIIHYAELFSKVSNCDFIRNLDVKPFARRHKKLYKAMKYLQDRYEVVHTAVNDVYDDKDFISAANEFNTLVDAEIDDIIAYWETKKPTGYKEFIHAYEKNVAKHALRNY